MVEMNIHTHTHTHTQIHTHEVCCRVSLCKIISGDKKVFTLTSHLDTHDGWEWASADHC